MDPHQGHQLIGIGEVSQVPDLGIYRRCRGLAHARNGAQILVQAGIPPLNLPVQRRDQALQLPDLPQQELQLKGQRISRPSNPDTLVCGLLHGPGFLGPKVARREPRQEGGQPGGGYGGQLFGQRLRLQHGPRGMATDITEIGGKLGKCAVQDTDDPPFHIANLRHQIGPQPAQLAQPLHRGLGHMRAWHVLSLEKLG